MLASVIESVAGWPAIEIVIESEPFFALRTLAAKVAGVCESGFRSASIVVAAVVYHQSVSFVPL